MTSSIAVERLEQAAQDVRPLLGLAQPEAGAADDDLDLVRRPSGGRTASSRSVRGTPSTSASMLAPKVSCSWVCL